MLLSNTTTRVRDFTVKPASPYIPTKTYDSYTWPDSVAPSKDVTPVPLTHLPVVNWRSRMDHFLAVPVSGRFLHRWATSWWPRTSSGA